MSGRRTGALAAAALLFGLPIVGAPVAEAAEECENIDESTFKIAHDLCDTILDTVESQLPQLVLLPGIGVEGEDDDGDGDGLVDVTFAAALVPPPEGSDVAFDVTFGGVGGGGDTATEEDDYEYTGEQVEFADGVAVETFEVEVVDDPDGLAEGELPVETFTVTLTEDTDDTDPTTASTQGFIVDNDIDHEQVLSVVPRTVIVTPGVNVEGENIEFTAVMVPPPTGGQTFTFDVVAKPGDATFGSLAADDNDFEIASGDETVTFDGSEGAPENAVQPIIVEATPDSSDEPPIEVFTVQLEQSSDSPDDVLLPPNEATGVIVDPEGEPVIKEVDDDRDRLPDPVDEGMGEGGVIDLDQENDEEGVPDAVEPVLNDDDGSGLPDALDDLLLWLLDIDGDGEFESDCDPEDSGCDLALDADGDGDSDVKDVAIIVFRAFGFADGTLRGLEPMGEMVADTVAGVLVPLFDRNGDGTFDAEDLDQGGDGNVSDQEIVVFVNDTVTLIQAGLTPTVAVQELETPVVEEGDDETDEPEVEFTVTVDPPSLLPVTVDYATSHDTTSDNDYTAASGTLEFGPLESEKTVTVEVQGDEHAEPDEEFELAISNPRILDLPDPPGGPVPPDGGPATIGVGKGEATATIEDDDGPAPVLTVTDVTVGEPAEGDEPVKVEVTVSLDKAPTQDITVAVETEAGTATADDNDDYEPTPDPDRLTFLPGETTKDVSITVNPDGLDEENETFKVRLSKARNAVVSSGSSGTGTVTIVDSDAEPVVLVGDVSVSEAPQIDGDPAVLNFPVTLSKVSGRDVDVHVRTTADSTATPIDDFGAVSTTKTIPAEQTSIEIPITIVHDTIYEGPQTVVLELDSATHATVGTSEATGTILDDEVKPELSVSGPALATVNEGDGGDTTDTVFTVKREFLDGTTETEVASTVGVSTVDGTAKAGSDYVGRDFQVEMPAGTSTEKTFTVTVNNDTLDEPDETFEVTLSGATNADIDTENDTVEVTIVDDDDPPELSIGDAESREEDADPSATVDVTLDQPSGKTVTVDVSTVDVSTVDGSAEVGSDYRSHTETLTFEPGDVTKSVTVEVFDDTLDEPDETFEVRLSNATTGTGDPPEAVSITDPLGEVTIVDDDDPPTLTIGPDVDVDENKEGDTTPVTIDVHLSHESGKEVRVNVETVDGSAKVGSNDYQLHTETLTFDPGDVTKPVTVNIIDDEHAEGDETFKVKLSNANTGVDNEPVVIADDGFAVVTIVNDDGPRPKLSVDDLTVEEAEGTASVTVTLVKEDGNVTQDVSVDVSTVDGTATSSGDNPDYVARSEETLEFDKDGPRTQTFDVTLEPDDLHEPGGPETFEVELSNASNAAIEKGTATVTLGDSDDPPTLSVLDATVTATEPEGDSGTGKVEVRVALVGESAENVTVDVAAIEVAGEAKAGSDYDPESVTDPLTFLPGDTEKTVTVDVLGDTIDEDDEIFEVRLSDAVNADIIDADAVGVVTIEDSDASPTLSVADTGASEGAGFVTFTVTRGFPAGTTATERTVTADYATSDGTAKAGSDYEARSDALTFGPDDALKTFDVPVTDDSLDEFDETLTVMLSGLTNADPGTLSATATIVDDDDEPAVSIGDARVVEGDSGRTEMVFAVTLSAPSAKTIQVRGSTVDGSATGGVDYVSAGGVGTLLPGAVSLPARVQVIGDTVDEPDETFRIVLSDPLNVRIGDGTGVGTIVDDDEPAEVLGATVTSDAYRVVDADGNVYVFDGSGQGRLETRIPTSAAVVGVASTPSGEGSWVLDAAGGIFSVGDAEFFGSVPELKRQGAPIGDGRAIDVSATPSGDGYWVLDSRGGMFTFGDAPFLGSVPGLRNAGVSIGEAPIVDVASTPSGKGYWVLDLHGGIFAFGDAQFFGSIPGLRAQDPSIGGARVAAMAPTPSGNGYWIVDTDGGIFAFGDARFFGSIPSLRAAGQDVGLASVLAITPTATGRGYFLVDVAGGVFTFGDARFSGSLPGIGVSTRAVGISAG